MEVMDSIKRVGMFVNLTDDDGDDDGDDVLMLNPTHAFADGTTKKKAISVEEYSMFKKPRSRFPGPLVSEPSSSCSGAKRFVIDISQRTLDFSRVTIDLTQENPDVEFHNFTAMSKASRMIKTECSNSKPLYVVVDDDDAVETSTPTFTCEICYDVKQMNAHFRIMGCNHAYCSDCISKFVASRLQENISRINCPSSGCRGVLEPYHCRSILPKQVFDRWGDALCEALVLASEKFYCPFKDCSALLLDEKLDVVQSECPECRRLFCAKCKVPWHSDIACSEFQKLHKDEREREDIQLMNLANGNQWKRCPNCRVYVERIYGCPFMICRCKCTFCYKCGAPAKDHYCRKCGT